MQNEVCSIVERRLVWQEVYKTSVVTSAIKATNMGLISSLKFVSKNKALPKSTKKLLFKVIDDYVQIIDELKNYLTEKYSQ